MRYENSSKLAVNEIRLNYSVGSRYSLITALISLVLTRTSWRMGSTNFA